MRPHRQRRVLSSWPNRHATAQHQQHGNRWSVIDGGDVGGSQRGELFVARVAEGSDPLRLMGDSRLEEVAHIAGIAESTVAGLGADEVSDPSQGIIAADVLTLLTKRQEDRDELV